MAKGLQAVVRACVQPSTRSGHLERAVKHVPRAHAARAQAAYHAEAVQIGHNHVQHHAVAVVRQRAVQRRLPADGIDAVIVLSKTLAPPGQLLRP